MALSIICALNMKTSKKKQEALAMEFANVVGNYMYNCANLDKFRDIKPELIYGRLIDIDPKRVGSSTLPGRWWNIRDRAPTKWKGRGAHDEIRNDPQPARC